MYYASEKLKGNKEVVLAAVTKNGKALQYASEELSADREVVLAAVTKCSDVLQYAFEVLLEELRDDKVVLTAVKRDRQVLQYASEELKNDKHFLIKCYRINKYTVYVNDFINKFDQLEKEIFDDTFIEQNKDILHLVENKEQLYEYMKTKENFNSFFWNPNTMISCILKNIVFKI